MAKKIDVRTKKGLKKNLSKQRGRGEKSYPAEQRSVPELRWQRRGEGGDAVRGKMVITKSDNTEGGGKGPRILSGFLDRAKGFRETR